jgi:hypothetical protein
MKILKRIFLCGLRFHDWEVLYYGCFGFDEYKRIKCKNCIKERNKYIGYRLRRGEPSDAKKSPGLKIIKGKFNGK